MSPTEINDDWGGAFDGGGSGSKKNECFNVKDYGAKGDGTTDDGAAITTAAAALIAAGGGVLCFDAGDYRVFNLGTTYTNLATFSGLNGVAIRGNGARLVIDPARIFTTSYGTIFVFQACTSIDVRNLRAIGTTTAADVTAGNVKGVEFIRLTKDNAECSFDNIYAESMVLGIISGEGGGAPTGNANRNIRIGNLETKNCVYGFASQYGPEGLVADNIRTDTNHRSVFLYGARNCSIRVDSKDPQGDDILLGQYDDVSDVDIVYVRRRDTTACGGSSGGVVLGFTTLGLKFRNIRVLLNVKFPGAATTPGSSVVLIRKGDNLSHGGVVENLDVSGRIENYPQVAGAPPGGMGAFAMIGNDPSNTWPVGDTWRHFWFHDLVFVNPYGLSARWFLNSLTGPLVIERVTSPTDFVLTDDTSPIIAPTHGSWAIRDSSFPNLYAQTANQLIALEYLNMGNFGVIAAIPASYSGHTLTNKGNGGTIITDTLPAAVVGLKFRLVNSDATNVFAFRLDPNGAEVIRGGGAGKYLSLDALGTVVNIECFTTGKWEVTYSYGTISFEP